MTHAELIARHAEEEHIREQLALADYEAGELETPNRDKVLDRLSAGDWRAEAVAALEHDRRDRTAFCRNA